jgi:hypothetical protein
VKRATPITIRRCKLRVTRRGGWSWGADVQALVRRAVERLPALLERRLSLLADSLPEDFEIVQPLLLRVPLGRAQWAGLSADAELSAHVRAQVEAAVDAALAQTLPTALLAAMQADEGQVSGTAQTTSAEVAAATAPVAEVTLRSRTSSLWKLLSQWRATGDLLSRLAALDEMVLRLWLGRLIEVDPAGSSAAMDEATVPGLWREVCALPILLPAGTARSLALRIVFVMELKTRYRAGDAHIRALLAAHCVDDKAPAVAASPENPSAENATGDETPPGTARTSTFSSATIVVQATSIPDASFEVDVPCALPFLMLTPLARAGYLATLSAALEAANAGSLAAGVALGLAHKCLAAPQRGWLREAGALAAAAAFAGKRDCDNELILGAGRALRPQLGLLDNCTAGQLLLGHRAEAGWLIAHSAAGALLLFDEDGLVPVATAAFAALAARIAPSGSVLFLPAHAANSEHLDTLDELQIPYACDGNLATRSSCSSFVAGDGTRLWISQHGAQQGRARGIAGRGTSLAESALANWSGLHDQRPAQRPGVDSNFETSLSLAAGFALSAIAWALWRQRSNATALAALENFSDLDAHVRVTPDRVHVTLPMGRRAWDLRDHGLLADVREVPWLGERTVTFGVG